MTFANETKTISFMTTWFRPYEIISFDGKRKSINLPDVWVIDSLENYLEFVTSESNEVFPIEDRCFDDQYLKLSENIDEEISQENLLKNIEYSSEKSGRLILITENMYAWEHFLDDKEREDKEESSRNLCFLNIIPVDIYEKNTTGDIDRTYAGTLYIAYCRHKNLHTIISFFL